MQRGRIDQGQRTGLADTDIGRGAAVLLALAGGGMIFRQRDIGRDALDQLVHVGRFLCCLDAENTDLFKAS